MRANAKAQGAGGGLIAGGSPGAADLAAMLSRAVEIICKYRGYKSLVKERKELFAGDAFPSLGDEGAAYSVAVENDEEA